MDPLNIAAGVILVMVLAIFASIAFVGLVPHSDTDRKG